MTARDDRVSERLERAIARASARGVDLNLGRPIEEYEDHEPVTGAPRRRDVKVANGKVTDPGIPGVLGARGYQTRTSVNRSITRQELAYAAAQMDALDLAAVLWCCNLDSLASRTLKAQLLIIAVELKDVQNWPTKILRAQCETTGLMRCPWMYVFDLCELALREAADPPAYKTEIARALYFGVTEQYWRRSVLATGYNAISARLTNWFRNGVDHLGRLLRARPD